MDQVNQVNQVNQINEITFIPGSDIVDSVLLEMSPYFENNMVDEALMYSEIAVCLDFLKTHFSYHILPRYSLLFTVKDYCYKLPEDFQSVLIAIACTSYKITIRDTVPNATYDTIITELPPCTTPADFCRDACGNLFQIKQQFGGFQYIHKDIRPLTISSTSEGCDQDCLNPKASTYDIQIKNGTLRTQFKEATIYMEYKSKLVTKEKVLVPDIYEVKEWMKFHLHYVIFRKLFRNKEDDARDRYLEAKQESSQWKEIARNAVKAKDASFKNFMALKAFMNRQFNALSLSRMVTLTKGDGDRFGQRYL